MYSRNVLLGSLQLALLDAAVVAGSLLTAVWLRHRWGLFSPWGPTPNPWQDYLFPAALLAAASVVLLRFHGLYAPRAERGGEAWRLVRAMSLATMGALALTFFYRGYSFSRASVLIFYPLCIVSLLLARRLFRAYSRAVLGNRAAARRLLIVGCGRVGRHLGRALADNPSYYRPVGFLDDDPALRGQTLDGVPVLGDCTALAPLLAAGAVDEVILAVPSAPSARVMGWIGECLRARVPWKSVPSLYDVTLERLVLDDVAGVPLIGLRGAGLAGFDWALKRAFDVAVASTVLIVTAPLFALIALAIKLTSRGPVLFRQTRVGLHGRPFTLLKFRSMRVASDPAVHVDFATQWIYGRSGGASDEERPAARSVGAAAARPDGGVHKLTRDPRITAVGRVLRRTSLDELPQFWNVLRGEMSVVGPRPGLPYEVRRYTEWHKRRLDVPPGITGLWQVSGRNALSFDEMVRLDIRYIESWSLEQDVRLVLRTIPALLLQRAY